MGKIVNEIKNLTNDRDMTLKELAQKIGEAQNKSYSLASLSQKLRKETISYKEIKLIAKILGYKIKFIDMKNIIPLITFYVKSLVGWAKQLYTGDLNYFAYCVPTDLFLI